MLAALQLLSVPVAVNGILTSNIRISTSNIRIFGTFVEPESCFWDSNIRNSVHWPVDFRPLIEMFERESNFVCFGFERNPSLSANCNALLAFVHSPNTAQYLSQIEKCIRFVCNEWCNSNGPLIDKWVLHASYQI